MSNTWNFREKLIGGELAKGEWDGVPSTIPDVQQKYNGNSWLKQPFKSLRTSCTLETKNPLKTPGKIYSAVF